MTGREGDGHYQKVSAEIASLIAETSQSEGEYRSRPLVICSGVALAFAAIAKLFL